MSKLIAVALLFSSSLFATSILPRQAPPLKLKLQPVTKQTKKHGRWHMAENGHAVYCYGPVVNAASTGNEPKRYATQCRGTNHPVPLHD